MLRSLADGQMLRVLRSLVYSKCQEFANAQNVELTDAKSVELIGSTATRSEDTETALRSTENATETAASHVSAEPFDFIEPVDPRESTEVTSPVVLPKWNGRRRRTACSKSFYFRYTYKRRSRLPTEEDELEVSDFLVTEDFRSRWDDVLVAAATMVKMKNPNYLAPVQKVSRPNCNRTRRGCRSYLCTGSQFKPTGQWLHQSYFFCKYYG